MSITAAEPSLRHQFETEFAGSKARYAKAQRIFPDGVTHDLRKLEPFPVYIERAKGSRKWDVDGHEFIDFWSGHGALLLGHCHPTVVRAVQETVAIGTHFGGCHDLEIAWGEIVQKLVPSAERVRFTASGTESTLMALRLARMFTNRPKVLKFVGHFHGWHDFVMPAAYAPYETISIPGIPADVSSNTVVIPPNDLALLERSLSEDLQIGAVILEPTGGHWGAVPIRGEFLRELRRLTEKHGQLLIFDEVITGFRVHPGGAQAHFGINPDLTTLAKILAGGLPGGALVGRADVLAGIETKPNRPKMRHPGTFNANPVSAAAGIATLNEVADGKPCRRANQLADLLRAKLNAVFDERFPDWVAYGDFSMFHVRPGYEGPRPNSPDFIPYGGVIEKLDGPKNTRLITAFRHGLLLNGVDWPGLGGWLTAAHSEADIEHTVAAVAATIESLRAEGIA
jgi:glutamate-1-semialdehyde 2,1-aminomutase